MNTTSPPRAGALDELFELLRDRLPPARAALASRLAAAFYDRTSPRELLSESTEDLYGSVLCLLDLSFKRAAGESRVRAYNPNPEDHRWHSTHSILEILTEDCPFLVSSIGMALDRENLQVHRITHPVLAVVRAADTSMTEILEEGETHPDARGEALMRFEIDHQTEEAEFQALEERVRGVIRQVGAVVSDWERMRDHLDQAIATTRECSTTGSPEDAERLAFLEWLREDNFLFLGFRRYQMEHAQGEASALVYQARSGLGLFRHIDRTSRRLSPFAPQESRQHPERLVITKSTQRSSIQRPAYLDFIGVRQLDAQGHLESEWHFFGLYASSAYTSPLESIPILRHKVQRIQEGSRFPADSHSGKTLRHLINNYPRDEMFQASYEELENSLFGMLECEERRHLRIFPRADHYGRFVTVLVLVPRDHYDTALRVRMRSILMRAYNGSSSDFKVLLTDHALAQVQFTIYCENAREQHLDLESLEAEMTEAMTSWSDRLHAALMERLGEAEANRLHRRFAASLPPGYRDNYSPRRAVNDLERLASAPLQEGSLSTYLYRPLEDPDSLHFKVLGAGRSLALSDVLPILEQMGVRVINAHPFELQDTKGTAFWMLDFRLSVAGSFDPGNRQLKERFQDTFTRTYSGELENDGFNALVIAAGLSCRQVVVLRAICKYSLQLGVPFSQSYIEQTLIGNPHICRQLIQLFEIRFDPDFRRDRAEAMKTQAQALEEALDAVANLDQDRILRHCLQVIQAMLRTNHYQGRDGSRHGYLSFKLATQEIPAAPAPRPRFEIFVYAPWVEGVHLRGGKVARGGLRWSDRREDFRTEVLGLVKAQLVKNAVIVPVGAKGGFVPKRLPDNREAVRDEVVRCYETFISALLDLTDNRDGERILPPPDVVRHDEDDPYLVVAADKGTATFSDIANRISLERGFWLGDAFASGGANGYDHKKMGITARGAWESVKRLFHELDKDCQTQDFTAIGIGDMSGDVFGNGMLLSPHTRLVAAFNHRHIFIDPHPDPDRSHTERARLFAQPGSSWDDYDRSLLSKGGDIIPRSAKSVTLSAEARKALDINQTRLSPNELIRALLQAPVDLLWNGGIGTYVKASEETDEQVGDRANDAIRIDGNELRARLVGEGGNLGLTQRGRIEYAGCGGLINTDAIDNAGGVDCSDHEVNIKILLDREVRAQELTLKQRNRLLADMTENVAQLVLRHNRLQSQIASLCNHQAPGLLADHRQLIQVLEQEGRLKRKLEALPTDEQLEEFARAGQGLTRPEIAVLIAYSKLRNFDLLVAEGIADDQDLTRELEAYFPTAIRKRYPEPLRNHPLRQELLATHVTNLVVNRMGSTFMTYLQEETRCSGLDAVRAFFAARDIFALERLWEALEHQEPKLPEALFSNCLIRIQHLLERTCLWLLRTQQRPLSLGQLVERFAAQVPPLAEQLVEDDAQRAQREALEKAGLAAEISRPLARLERNYYCLDMVRLAGWVSQTPDEAAAVYLAIEDSLGLQRLRQLISRLPQEDIWSRKARASLADELDKALVRASERLFTTTDASLETSQRLAQWQQAHAEPLDHFHNLCTRIAKEDTPNLAMLSVAVRELGQLN